MPAVEAVIAGYIKLRDARDEIKKRHSKELTPLSGKMKTMEAWLLNELNKAGLDSFNKNGVGTAFKSTRTSAKVADWEVSLDYIKENDLWHMLEKRISKMAVEEFIEANGEAPPGIAITREVTVNIRRS